MSQEKLQTMVMRTFWGVIEVYYIWDCASSEWPILLLSISFKITRTTKSICNFFVVKVDSH